MKLRYSALLTILTTSLIKGVQGACYSATCATTDELVSGTYLQASCGKEGGGNLATELNLDNCFWNNNGVLTAGNGGDYSSSCSGCGLSFDSDGSVWLGCSCKPKSGSAKGTSINICNTVWNNNGYLDCYGHLGSTY